MEWKKSPLAAPVATSRWHVPSTGDSGWRQSFPAFYSCCAAPWGQTYAHARSTSWFPPLSLWEDWCFAGEGENPAWNNQAFGGWWLLSPFGTQRFPSTLNKKPANNRVGERNQVQARWNIHGERHLICPFAAQETSRWLSSLPPWFLLAEIITTLQFTLDCPLLPALSQSPDSVPSPFPTPLLCFASG